jgi:hypothetical protein
MGRVLLFDCNADYSPSLEWDTDVAEQISI